MSRGNIYRPTGGELADDLESGVPICNNCGAIMDYVPKQGGAIYECPGCGWKGRVSNYISNLMPDNDFYYSDDDIPEGCAACGGPYPDCIDSCNLFDD